MSLQSMSSCAFDLFRRHNSVSFLGCTSSEPVRKSRKAKTMHLKQCCFLQISSCFEPVGKAWNYRSCEVSCCAQQSTKPSAAPFLLEMYGLRYTVPMNQDARILRGVNFAIRERQFVVIVGENGAGKSTLLKMMTGLMAPDKGKFYWKGNFIRRKHLRNGMGMVMQRPADFFLCENILNELVFGRDYVQPDDVRQALLGVGLDDVSLLQHPKRLSGGQMKRLAIADQLICKPRPELLLLDEPMAGVDMKGRHTLAHLLASLSKELAVVVVSHEPDELLPHADRVVQLARGRIYEVDKSIIRRALELRIKRTK